MHALFTIAITMSCNASLEIRKLAPNAKKELEKMLDQGRQWQTLMSIVPKTLTDDYNAANIKQKKYGPVEIKLVEDEATRTGRSFTEILFDEWGTSGRIRPKVGHLLQLLIKAEAFQAADYVAVHLLGQSPPDRPKQGPAAAIDIPKLDSNADLEEFLKNMKCGTSTIMDGIKCTALYTNINYSDRIECVKSIEKVMIESDPGSSVHDGILPQLSYLMQQQVSEVSKASNESSTISFAEDCMSDTKNESSESKISPDSLIVRHENVSDHEVPAFSKLLSLNDNAPSVTTTSPSDKDYIPAFSELNITNTNLMVRESSSYRPVFLNTSETLSTTQSAKNSSRSACVSPLPVLSLNTTLKEYSYHQLEAATMNFDNTPHSSVESPDGRFLGSGAFGSVFLAVGLTSTPVAVKKLHLENAEAVGLDDLVTKQFVNEVELLCEYKHENLLSILGYSCDGPTYCLLYEYVSGGTLKDRLLYGLKNKDCTLLRQQRLNIALGTAKAIKYLHTNSTPLIHRDIKSANILLDATNTPKLCDFGLIKLKTNQNTTSTKIVYGTSAYMAPEATRGDVSLKMDTWSYGVVLLELLTALPPVDENRDGIDLVTFIRETCAGVLQSELLDLGLEAWCDNGTNYAGGLFRLANKCLMDRKIDRPLISDVEKDLTELMCS